MECGCFWHFKKVAAPFDRAVESRDSAVKSTLLLSVAFVCGFAGEGCADRVSENSSILRRPTQINCEMVRAYVGRVGVQQARAMALAAGMTLAQERRAVHCLQEKI